MAARARAGIPGTETPRLKDAPVPSDSVPKRPPNADARARKAIAKALIGFLTEHGADEATRRRWLMSYRAFARGLPSKSASVCSLCADRVRNSYLAERYTLEAQAAGTATPAGAKLAAMAHGCDMHAQRFGLTARDIAYREAGKDLDGVGPHVLVSLDDIAEARAAIEANEAPVIPPAPTTTVWPAAATVEVTAIPIPAPEPVEFVDADPMLPPSSIPTPPLLPPAVLRELDPLTRIRLETTANPEWRRRQAEGWDRFLEGGGGGQPRESSEVIDDFITTISEKP